MILQTNQFTWKLKAYENLAYSIKFATARIYACQELSSQKSESFYVKDQKWNLKISQNEREQMVPTGYNKGLQIQKVRSLFPED